MTQQSIDVLVPPSKQKVDVSHGPDTRVIAAIDFGTTHSGFASAHIVEKNVQAYYLWDDRLVPYSKTLTAILYKYDHKDAKEINCP
ncbi:hypothetical protein BC938DRAFT_470902 [Jimgerdemannia flammicorona]|uniref:Uncharacterized protein n=1 Tax=Jimgerdemannia flammicorona TaxID=994334 RepID=A0A433Q982_9FUNG|nr:hypothetical protein BC938DRAFT_470902 [Jimgerdemannia flammicorona]